MASNKKIAEIIMAIKTVYTYYTKDNNESENVALLNTWKLLLNDYSDDVVEVAFKKCLQTCKMPPTPADVIERINDILGADEQTDEELWIVYADALRQTEKQMYYFPFTFVQANGKTQGDNARQKVEEIWQGLPDRIKQYVGSKGELMRMAKNYTNDELKFEKTRFIKTLPTIKKREEYSKLKLLIGDNRPMIEQEARRGITAGQEKP